MARDRRRHAAAQRSQVRRRPQGRQRTPCAQTLTARTVCKDEGNSKPAPPQKAPRNRQAQRAGRGPTNGRRRQGSKPYGREPARGAGRSPQSPTAARRDARTVHVPTQVKPTICSGCKRSTICAFLSSTVVFELQSVAGRPPGEQNRRLLIDGSFTGIVVAGTEISGTYRFGELTVIVIHHDYFDAIQHHFYVINSDGVLLDHVSAPDSFGFMQAVVRDSAMSICFGFFGTPGRWRLSVVPAGRWAFRVTPPFITRRFLHLHSSDPLS